MANFDINCFMILDNGKPVDIALSSRDVSAFLAADLGRRHGDKEKLAAIEKIPFLPVSAAGHIRVMVPMSPHYPFQLDEQGLIEGGQVEFMILAFLLR